MPDFFLLSTGLCVPRGTEEAELTIRYGQWGGATIHESILEEQMMFKLYIMPQGGTEVRWVEARGEI